MKTSDFGDSMKLQTAVGMIRPPQRDASMPGFEAGVRLSMPNWASGFVAGAGAQTVQPASLGLSGTYRQIKVTSTPTVANNSDLSTYNAGGLAADLLVPIIPSSDGKDPKGTLTLSAEYTRGSGYGDEFNGWTAGSGNPVNGNGGNDANLDIDAGIGGLNAKTNPAFELINLETFNFSLQYHLPSDSHCWISAGYGKLYSDNAATLVFGNGNAVYDTDTTTFVNFNHQFSAQIRGAVEYAHYTTHYVANAGTDAQDDRYQINAWYMF
jgi:hypothetical protein